MARSTKSHVDLTIMLVSHDAFRRDLRRLERAAAGRGPGGDPLARERVATGWQIFKAQLHIHHEGEDRDLWPRMAAGLAHRPGTLATLRDLEAEHELLDPLLARVDAVLADPLAPADRAEGAVAALAACLESHLEHEETEGLPYIEEALTAAQWKEFTAVQRESLGPAGAAELFPWLLDEASEENLRRVREFMPAPMRMAMKTLWAPAYRARNTWSG
ncbi:hemerythrin domain-containing protein [Streptomyces sp. CRN 30]|uniref:hemerythrin domain-containing protein n=1 Tax=Streptomyces sp. CRN 30 TaxID=3075613 RepID=UPI002A829DD0|nr:hemerythrin domain-containing protein [Streptomyces sp. CRN 30]